MYMIEATCWKMHRETAEKRKEKEALFTAAQRRLLTDAYESDLLHSCYSNEASETPAPRGPVYVFNKNHLEMRCGGSEEKRGLITGLTLMYVSMLIYTWIGFNTPNFISIYCMAFCESPRFFFGWGNFIFDLLLTSTPLVLYFKYGLQFTRWEMLTSRHLLIRFNRVTRQVHLHRPKSCGGIVTLPWEATISTATGPDADHSVGSRLILYWHPRQTGLAHSEIAFLGKQSEGGSDLRDEWEFIRRYMEEGPDSVPKPRLTTQLPSPLQAFSPQFEGMHRYFRNSTWRLKLALPFIWPAFAIIGTGHWLSLLLCWKPRWPKIIREAGQPGKPVPAFTTLRDYPPEVQERLLANADRWEVKPGQRPEKKPRARRARRQPTPQTPVKEE